MRGKINNRYDWWPSIRLSALIKKIVRGVVILVGCAASVSSYGAKPSHFFFEEQTEEGRRIVKAISIFKGKDYRDYRYQPSENYFSGELIRELSSNLAVVAREEGDFVSVGIARVEGGQIVVTPIQGVKAVNFKAIDVREGDNQTFHLAWMTPDKRTIHYAHIDLFAESCCLSVAAYRHKDTFNLPPSFYLSPHILVGRGRVGVVETQKRGGNPETKLNVFQVNSLSGGIESEQLNNPINFSPKRSDSSIAEIQLEIGVQSRRGGLTKLPYELSIGSHLQPEAEHSWYGGSYIALSHHLNTAMTMLELKLVAVLSDRSDSFDASDRYERIYSSGVSVLSNLAEPINSYESGLGRGGLAWLESSSGHKVSVVVFRDGNLDTQVPLNSEIAGAVSIRKSSGQSLYWMDQGEEFLPVVLLKTGDGIVYQVDLEDPDDFTMLPIDNKIHQLLVWSAQSDLDDEQVAFVLPLSRTRQPIGVYLLTRRWEGADLRYFWEPIEAI